MGIKARSKLNTGTEMDMKPFINFMITLSASLIVSVEFSKIAVIDMKLPEGRGSQTETAQVAPPPEEGNKLLLTAIITDSVVTLGAKGGFLPSLFYREYHHYVAKDGGFDDVIPYISGQEVKNPKTGRILTVQERDEIYLYVLNEDGTEKTGIYYQDQLVTNSLGDVITSVNKGDTVWLLTVPRLAKVVANTADYKLHRVSAYDELKNRLMKVKERFTDAEDISDIIIVAENNVLYDKIVQIMDVCRAADFPNISIGKFRT